jgi:hypothetical protein
MKDALPLARKDSLIVKEVDNETLVYDLHTDQALCLNDTAAQVWKSCDGKTSVNDISGRLSARLNSTIDENVVWLALDQLEKFKLLSVPTPRATHQAGISRRHAVRAIGLSAIILPVITSLVVPTVTQAQSLNPTGNPPPVPQGGCCVNPNDCLTPGANCVQDTVTPCTNYVFNPQQSGKQCDA